MQSVKSLLVLAPDVQSLATAKLYQPYGSMTLFDILSEVHRRTPSTRWPSTKRRYAVFNVYPHCFSSLQLRDLTEERCTDLAKRVLAAMLDCETLTLRDPVAIHRIIERYHDGPVSKNLFIVGRNVECKDIFSSALVAEDEELLIGMLIVELLEDRIVPTVKRVLTEMAYE